MAACKRYKVCWMLAAFLFFCGCPQYVKIPAANEYNVYTVHTVRDDPATRFAPAFLVYDYDNRYNRIGRPSARNDEKGREHIYIDTEDPVIYYMVREFTTDKGTYTNYIYRVHFPGVPFSLIPFHLSAGHNVGHMIVVTVDAKNQPVLITTVHTCGCYLAILPTSYLPPDAFPDNWEEKPLTVYGERLPGKLDYTNRTTPRILVHLRPAVHRAMDIQIIEESDLHINRGFRKIIAPLVHMDELTRIPLNHKTTSFYYDEGPLQGHVKGSMKLWESILLGLISLDVFVGTDKVYAPPEKTDTPFYTSLKPWNRNASDMWDFPRFLRFWGWRL